MRCYFVVESCVLDLHMCVLCVQTFVSVRYFIEAIRAGWVVSTTKAFLHHVGNRFNNEPMALKVERSKGGVQPWVFRLVLRVT